MRESSKLRDELFEYLYIYMSKTTTVFINLPSDVLAHTLAYSSTKELLAVASVNPYLHHLILLDGTLDSFFFRDACLRKHPSVVLSALERSVSTSCSTCQELLRHASLRSVEWLESESSDRKALKKPSQSRSVYAVRIEAGAKRRFIRLGGHYFFKLGYCPFADHVLDSGTGKISGGCKWFQPRVHGIAAAPLRGFSLTSLQWSLPSLAAPVTVVFGGAETSYPFQESNTLMLIAPLKLQIKMGSKKTLWLWLRGDVAGTPPQPRRGCSATPIGEKSRQIVFVGGSNTSPCKNFNDIHILDTRGVQVENELNVMSRLENTNDLPTILSGMVWSTVNTLGSMPSRSSHVALKVQEEPQQNKENQYKILVFGGFQLGGKTSMFDVHSLLLKTSAANNAITADDDVTTATASWNLISLKPKPSDRTGASTFLVGNKLLLMGGHSASQWVNGENNDKSSAPIDVLVFNPLPEPHWYRPKMLGNIPTTRCSAALTLFGPVLLMSGGYESSKQNARAKLLNKVDSMRMRFGS